MLENTEVVFGLVARWDPIKDHANLLNALSYLKRNGKLDNFVCVVVGDGCDLNNQVLVELLEDLDLKDNVRLMGFRKDIPVFMSMFDLVVLPSKGEGFPNVLAEAMVYGVPCVSTNVGDAKVIVGDTGWIVEPSDHVALAEAISKALITRQDAVLWQRIKNDCHERITQNFSMSTMVSNYLTTWAS
jgi:glycosyltransferase involved in cell wall biosynthesis